MERILEGNKPYGGGEELERKDWESNQKAIEKFEAGLKVCEKFEKGYSNLSVVIEELIELELAQLLDLDFLPYGVVKKYKLDKYQPKDDSGSDEEESGEERALKRAKVEEPKTEN